MNTESIGKQRKAPIKPNAFTLIEMIGVLAVLAILAAALLPALIKETDTAVANQESATLQSFGTALQNDILRYRQIPDNTTWIAAITNELGISSNSVALTVRNQSRIFLIDTNGFGGSSFLPYTQTSTGTNLPPNPRFMIVSSLGAALPGGLISRPVTNIFNDIWGTTSGNLPTNSLWSGWNNGNGTDLVIQRLNIAPLFVHLVLTTNSSSASAFYSIDSGSTIQVTTTPIDSYFIQNSILSLFTTNNTQLDSQQILQRDISFVYDQSVWRNSITSISTNSAWGAIFADLASQFLKASVPPSGGGVPTPQTIVTDFTNYMNAYDAWANASFPSHSSSAYTAATAAQTTLQNDINSLYKNVKPQ